MAAEQVRDLIQCETTLVPILSDDQSEYTYLSGAGANAQEVIGETLPIVIGVCGWVLRNKKPWWRGMLDDLLPHERNLWEKEASNMLLVPLAGKNRFLGGIACMDKQGGFDERDYELLNIISTPIALALENSLLVNDLESKITSRTAQLLKEKDKAEKANAAKSEFLANVSHELRTPMHVILGYSSMGLNNLDDVDMSKHEKYYANIHKSGERLLLLLNDLLDLSKYEAGKMQLSLSSVQLHDVVCEALQDNEPLARNKKIHITYEPVLSDTTILIDANKIIQVLNNLISNAIKFCAAEGDITVAVYEDYEPLKDGESEARAGGALAVSVTDNGVGIPEQELSTIFDKFIQSSRTSTQAGGTGLGLSICKDIVNQHGGVIYAENNAGPGVVFTFVLPRKQPDSQ